MIKNPTRIMIVMSMGLAVIFTILAAFLYFKPARVKANGKLGLGFGLIATGVAFALDGLLAAMMYFQGQAPSDIFSMAYEFWLLGPMLALTLIGTMSVGIIMGKQQIS